MERPAYAGIQSMVNSGDKIRECIRELEASLKKAFDDRVTLVERKLATVTQENLSLHREPVILAREIQKLKEERREIAKLLGAEAEK